MNSVSEIFGSMVFNDSVMKERLPKETYKALHKTIENGKSLDPTIANVVANAMKDWAISKGATHYTHWFEPMTGITAEKHDSFISPENGSLIMEFSGKELVRGEPDASSFPTGGLRATFEARGYTAWDPTSYAFVKNGVLCIPTAFCSYGGHALDKKTPLLRSTEEISKQAKRILKLFGNDNVKTVKTTVGAEQEYFLIDKSVYEAREDLVFTGRTLFGAKPPKGQELDDHYFGTIKPRVKAYMCELNQELWKLGIPAKTEHNEAAPAQHELAPIYTTTNMAVDNNYVTMELMQTVAKRHDMVCLLHEKPFEGINGSGKHNNWSISTDTGINLLDPGETPYDNAQFLVFLTAVIKAVDDYQDLLRISVASASNDHRLGGGEAPPAIVSIFLGDELDAVVKAVIAGKTYTGGTVEQMRIGVHVLPKFPKDNTDRNRTSPFAFTGNKFEFRMLGSSASVADPNIVLNTAVAESLRQFADELENAKDFGKTLNNIIRKTLKAHQRIIFNGNGYDDAWKAEAEKRGLLNLPTTPDALPYFLHEKNIELFTSHKVYTREEMEARYEIMIENYCKAINIEALTMLQMVKRNILPAVSKYAATLCEAISSKKSVSDKLDITYESDCAAKVSKLTGKLHAKTAALEKALSGVGKAPSGIRSAFYYKDKVLAIMNDMRPLIDELETLTDESAWPLPSYNKILFSVK